MSGQQSLSGGAGQSLARGWKELIGVLAYLSAVNFPGKGGSVTKRMS